MKSCEPMFQKEKEPYYWVPIMKPASLILLRIFRVRSCQKLLFSFHTCEHKPGAGGTPDTQSTTVKMKIQSQICTAWFRPSWPKCQGGAKVIGSNALRMTPNMASLLIIGFPLSLLHLQATSHASSVQYTSGGWKLEKKARLDWLSCQWLLRSAHPVITAIHFPKTLLSSSTRWP